MYLPPARAHVLVGRASCPSLPYVMTSVAQYSPSLCGNKRGRASPEADFLTHQPGKRWRHAGYHTPAPRSHVIPSETRRRLVLLIAQLTRMNEQVRLLTACIALPELLHHVLLPMSPSIVSIAVPCAAPASWAACDLHTAIAAVAAMYNILT